MAIFNKARRKHLGKNFKKYLLYASGEIILVVVGILLAVGINNYFSKKANKEYNNSKLIQIHQHLVTDSLKVHKYLIYLEKLKETLSSYGSKNKRRKIKV